MPRYNVHIYREMRVCFVGIEADTPEAAAAIAGGRSDREADDVDDCDGDDLAALVDITGGEGDIHSLAIDFPPERQRKAACCLYTALRGIIDYAESEAFSLESLKDGPDAEEEAKRAWDAVEAARAAMAAAADLFPATAEVQP